VSGMIVRFSPGMAAAMIARFQSDTSKHSRE